MSLVVNMHQRRTVATGTVATGRQNQDPNTPVNPEKKRTSKRLQPEVQKSIEEVLNHSRNTKGRGRSMVLAALQKKAAEQKNPATVKTSPVKRNQRGGSAQKNAHSDDMTSALVAPELQGSKIPISDIRKRHVDQDQARAPLTVLDASAEDEPKTNWKDLAGSSPSKPSRKEETPVVYQKKQKTESASPIPAAMMSNRRPVTYGASPLPLPSPPPAPESKSPCSRNVTENPAAGGSMPTVEQVVEITSLQPAKRHLVSPSQTQEESDLCGSSAVVRNVEASNPIACQRDSESQILELQNQMFSFIPTSSRRMHGLSNLGNTCFMNVIIQCLYNLTSFVAGMEQFFGPLLNKNAPEGSAPLMSQDAVGVHTALLKVFRDLKHVEGYETVNPSVLKQAFAKHQSSFWDCIQQDAHEFFCSLVDQVQENVSCELKRLYPIDAERPKLETVCPTTQNFSCLVRNSLTCTACGKVSSVEETYRDFCLALPEDERTDESKDWSLESLLNLYFQESTICRKCEGCGAEDSKARAQILQLPHVLVLQLKRLHMDRDFPCTKVTSPVKFNSRLDIGPWCAQDKQKFWSPTNVDSQNYEGMESAASVCSAQDKFVSISQGTLDCRSQDMSDTSGTNRTADVGTSYRLYGVVNHLGFTSTCGHFLADTLDPEANRWLRCDDSLVTDVSEDSVSANVKEAYMFFYVHQPVSS
ncbi:uncharacterized protein [Physcomitrium patens]|uniref:Ubiquitin carboxyl-terminal hydrolase n=1 Tax=Physcomitrium patens TaxID=3218 RepID=A0A2K1II10_PHYPA|nr:ubiquitin carboxyl-terminal hydrolase 37-like [Physcomitrium patens]PNR28910.1 hypothetical protein PHYPA_027602 [Physcomitrium patens]|eukprot:XP_024362854.1 ubiquitin carboxyl-terminal hydrolase 37-like [Physcomitrella patens]